MKRKKQSKNKNKKETNKKTTDGWASWVVLITTSFKSLPLKLYSAYQRKLVLASLGILIGACTDSPMYNFTNSDYGVLVLYVECVENLCICN